MIGQQRSDVTVEAYGFSGRGGCKDKGEEMPKHWVRGEDKSNLAK